MSTDSSPVVPSNTVTPELILREMASYAFAELVRTSQGVWTCRLGFTLLGFRALPGYVPGDSEIRMVQGAGNRPEEAFYQARKHHIDELLRTPPPTMLAELTEMLRGPDAERGVALMWVGREDMLDISPCRGCGRPTACVPEGLQPTCHVCHGARKSPLEEDGSHER
jgi:hypothetical protein